MFLNFSGKQDVYLEIAERYEGYILSGLYSTGEKLPSVRQVASELGVNPNTVAKAYSVLEEKGLIRALPKKGAFVIYGEDAAKPSVPDVRQVLIEMKEQGLSYEELLSQAKEVYGSNDQN